MNTYLIYKVTCSVNGKVYIGQCANKPVEERFGRHIKDALANRTAYAKRSKFYRAIRKYGPEAFCVMQLDAASSQSELDDKEKFWIQKYNSIRLGYNCAEGGEGGNTYKGLPENRLAEIKRKIGRANYGRNNGLSKALKCKSALTQKEYHFETLTACLNFLGIKNKGVVMDRANRRVSTLWRHEWLFAMEQDSYAEYYDFHYDPSCRKGHKVKLVKDSEELSFNSMTKAAEFLHVSRTAILPDSTINGYRIIC